MKRILLGLLVVAVVLLVACTAPAQDATRAAVKETTTETPTKAVEQKQAPVAKPAGMEKVPISKIKSSFEFEGFGPGKSHVGTFKEIDGSLILDDGEIVGAEGTFQVKSIDTGIAGLDKHLKSDDFFDVANHPTIIFVSKSIKDGVMTGDLGFMGIKKELSFPVKVGPNSVSADFVFNTVPFGFEHAGVNEEVRIAFTAAK